MLYNFYERVSTILPVNIKYSDFLFWFIIFVTFTSYAIGYFLGGLSSLIMNGR